MAATRLPDGSVVMRPSGQRAIPSSGGTGVTIPSVAKGAGSGRGGRGAAIRGKQPGRVGSGRTAYR